MSYLTYTVPGKGNFQITVMNDESPAVSDKSIRSVKASKK